MLEFPSSQKQNLAPCLQFVYTFILLITYIFLIFDFEHEIRAKPIFSMSTGIKEYLYNLHYCSLPRGDEIRAKPIFSMSTGIKEYLYNLHYCSLPRVPAGRAICLHQLACCFTLKYCPWYPGIEKNRS